jgi:hypothetical protein
MIQNRVTFVTAITNTRVAGARPQALLANLLGVLLMWPVIRRINQGSKSA